MAYLEITLKVAKHNRTAAAGVYTKYRETFLTQIKGAQSKELLIRDEDVQVLHRFDAVNNAQSYVAGDLFTRDVAGALQPFLQGAPDVRIYETA